jgi:prevent-host-death family protein
MWSVQEAKAKLSEVLRRARAGEPQTIGTQEPCVVISAESFDKVRPAEHLGQFLLASAPRGEPLRAASRRSRRGDPFAEDAGKDTPAR